MAILEKGELWFEPIIRAWQNVRASRTLTSGEEDIINHYKSLRVK